MQVLSQHVDDTNYGTKIKTWVNLGQDFAHSYYVPVCEYAARLTSRSLCTKQTVAAWG